MTSDIRIVEEPGRPLSMHPKKFAMWLFIATVVMLFASLTSAYIVREAEGNWLYFELPNTLYVTSILIVISSVTIHLAYLFIKRDEIDRAKILMVTTAVLGVAFLVGQVVAWGQLVEGSIYLVGNPSGSFLYVLTGLHGLHLVSALVFLAIVLVATFRYEVHSKSLIRIEMCVTYWHFLGVLWLYLFVFLQLTR